MNDDQVLDRASRLLGSSLSLRVALSGGEHARTLMAEAPSGMRVVVRHFPAGDPAGAAEVGLYPALRPLGALVPRLLAADVQHPEGSVLITTYVDGAPPLDVNDDVLARELGAAMARVHAQSGAGLRCVPPGPPAGSSQVCSTAREAFPDLALDEPVLLHYDFWVGNTLWRDGHLVAVVDWSGARRGPCAVDVAWLRLDLILQGRDEAADLVVDHYERHAGRQITDLVAWDLQAAAQADPVVESWLPNYHGIGLVHLTAEQLRQRLDCWSATLLAGRNL